MKKLLLLVTLFAFTLVSNAQKKNATDTTIKTVPIEVKQDTVFAMDKPFITAQQIEAVMVALDEKLISGQHKIVRAIVDELYKVAWQQYYIKKKAELMAANKPEENEPPPTKAKPKK